MPALVELRVLEGPNLYFPRAAIKLTLDVDWLSAASEDDVRQLAGRLGFTGLRAGRPGSGFRQRALIRLVARIIRRIAYASGTSRLAVRVRPTSSPTVLVVAFPWRDRARATALAESVAAFLDSCAHGGEVEALIESAAARITATEPGPGPTTIRPKVPVIAVTGTNGKTTTSRLIAHIARGAGHLVGWSNTDGIYVDGELVEAGDYSGPSGAGRVLAHREVDFAVTETARGGILLKGIGVASNDVSVVTNVTADHLGLQGIDTLDQLAEVKSVVPWITRKSGWAVLNADDPRVFAMRSRTAARPWVFTRDADSPSIREVLRDGGRATTVIDGWLTTLQPQAQPLVEIAAVPMTLAGLSRFNVENALAAASAALAAGISRADVAAGLRSFQPDAQHNPGRMNLFTLDGATVVIDLAHNEAGLEALIEIMRGVRGPGGRLLLGLGAVGDRTDELIEALGEIGARDSDVAVIGHKLHYLRGRTRDELEGLLRAGAERVGVPDVPAYDTEVEALAALAAHAHAGDVIGLMCHAQREEVYAWLAEHGATPDDAETLRAKVDASHPDRVDSEMSS